MSTTAFPRNVSTCPPTNRMLPASLWRPANSLAKAFGCPLYGGWNGLSLASPGTPQSRNSAVFAGALIVATLQNGGRAPPEPGTTLASKSPMSLELMASEKLGYVALTSENRAV